MWRFRLILWQEVQQRNRHGKPLCNQPVAMIMIHNVSMTRASGDYREMQKNAEILQQMNSALAQAFVNKTGRSEDEILKMMDEETWLTANQAVEYGFVDGVMEEKISFY